jgi:DNA repair protein RecN (Recombination protein N)
VIRYLAIRNLAVIEAAAVDFAPSFNVLTGETGAGKSILVEAVGLLLGGRASQDLIRTGEDLATVEAIFEVDGSGSDQGPREVAVRREVTAQGRSRAFVDGALATASTLKELSARFVELHGQHEHQALLDPLQHVALVDRWGGLDGLQKGVAGCFQRVRHLRDRSARLRMDSRERAARLELVGFQLSELHKANLRPDEDDELRATRDVLRNAEAIRRLCADSYAELYEAEASVLSGLGHVWKRVADLAVFDPRFTAYTEQGTDIKAQLEDLALALRDFSRTIDAPPGRLEQVEDRLALLERLKRRHGPTLGHVIDRRDALESEIEELTRGESSAGSVEEELRLASGEFLRTARELSARRRDVSRHFATALTTELAELAMERSRVELRLVTSEDESEWSDQGIDAGELYLSTNVGEDLRPLARVVSGGELSRIMLALKTLTAMEGPSDRTLVFDEVDAGIGGRVATVVGRKLQRLGERFQVLCITHLPQIAAAASTHFLIEKVVRRNRTLTSVRTLDQEGRVSEIARMMGGADARSEAETGARALLAAAKAKAEPGSKAKGEETPGRKRKPVAARAPGE